MVACAAGMLLLAADACRARGPAGARRFVLFAYSPLLVWEITAQAHNDGLMVLALVAFVLFARRGRRWCATGALAFGLYAKFAVLPVLGLTLVQTLRRSHFTALLMAGLVASAGVLAFAPFWDSWAIFHGPLTAAVGGVDRVTRSVIDTVLLLTLPFGPAARKAVYLVLDAAGTAMLAVLAVRLIRRTREVDDVMRGSLVFLLAWQLVTPWYQGWYATWLLPFLLVIDDPGWQRRRDLLPTAARTIWGAPRLADEHPHRRVGGHAARPHQT